MYSYPTESFNCAVCTTHLRQETICVVIECIHCFKKKVMYKQILISQWVSIQHSKKIQNISVFRTMCHLTRIFFMPAKLLRELQNLLSLSTTYLSSLLMLAVNVHRDRNGSSVLTLSHQFSFLFHPLNLTKYYWKTGQL